MRLPAGNLVLSALLTVFCAALPVSCEESQRRIERPQAQSPVFTSILPGVSQRWWRNFRSPSFCSFVLCNGSCADIFGVPRIGFYSWEQLFSKTTPCSLEDINISAGSCCMSKRAEECLKCDEVIELCD